MTHDAIKIAHAGLHMHVRLDAQTILLDITSALPGLDIQRAVLGDLTVAHHPVAWQRLSALRVQRDTTKTRYVFDAFADALTLTHIIECVNEYPVLRMWSEVRANADHAVVLTACALLHVVIPQAPLYVFHVDQFSWAYRRDFFTPHQSQIWPGRTPVEIRMGSYPSHYDGATSCAWFAVRPPPHDRDPHLPNSGPGIFVGIEFNGKSRVHAHATPTTTHIRSTIDALAHPLAAGDMFEVPAVFIGRYAGDWDEAGYQTQRYAHAHIHPALPDDRYPWVQYNSWKYGQEINEAQQLTAIDTCHALGIEVFVIDLGWANCIGDWFPNAEKFPRGLAPLAQRARQYGMRFGVHIAMAQCAPHAPIATEHPEWLIHTYDDYFGAGILCFGHEPCRDWMIAQISRLIETEQIDYIIQDGEDMVKFCPRIDHSHAPGNSNYANSQQGLDVIIATIRARYPHVVIENCEDGGMMMTYKMARLYHTSITVDNIATYATRQGIYGASYPFAPRYSVRYMEDDPTPYTLRSALFGGPLIFMQRITEWTPEQFRDAQAAIAEYKAFRTLIRDAKVVHLLPPQANVAGGYGWDAIQAVRADYRESVVMVYRAHGDTPQRTIYPRGLDATVQYDVSLRDAGTHASLSGADIMQHGILVALREESAEIVHITLHKGATYA